jgi:hypothetical protein
MVSTEFDLLIFTEMFLDDELYKKVKSTEIKSPEDFTIMIKDLYEICSKYYKAKLSIGMSYKEGRQLIDKVFISWDFFIKKLEKEDWWLIDVLNQDNLSFKNFYLKNEVLRRIYEKGK